MRSPSLAQNSLARVDLEVRATAELEAPLAVRARHAHELAAERDLDRHRERGAGRRGPLEEQRPVLDPRGEHRQLRLAQVDLEEPAEVDPARLLRDRADLVRRREA